MLSVAVLLLVLEKSQAVRFNDNDAHAHDSHRIGFYGTVVKAST